MIRFLTLSTRLVRESLIALLLVHYLERTVFGEPAGDLGDHPFLCVIGILFFSSICEQISTSTSTPLPVILADVFAIFLLTYQIGRVCIGISPIRLATIILVNQFPAFYKYSVGKSASEIT